MQLFDVAARHTVHTLAHDRVVRHASLAGDGKLVLTHTGGKELRLWSVADGTQQHAFEHDDDVRDVAVAPDGRSLLSAADRVVTHWDVATRTSRVALAHECAVSRVWFAAGSTLAVTVSAGEKFEFGCEAARTTLWDLETGERRATFDAELMGLSPEGRFMFAVTVTRGTRGSPSALHVYDIEWGEQRFSAPFQFDAEPDSGAFSPDGRLLTVRAGNSIKVLMVSGALLRSRLAASTTMCMPAGTRRQFLRESADEARRHFDDCERRHGRQ